MLQRSGPGQFPPAPLIARPWQLLAERLKPTESVSEKRAVAVPVEESKHPRSRRALWGGGGGVVYIYIYIIIIIFFFFGGGVAVARAGIYLAMSFEDARESSATLLRQVFLSEMLAPEICISPYSSVKQQHGVALASSVNQYGALSNP